MGEPTKSWSSGLIDPFCCQGDIIETVDGATVNPKNMHELLSNHGKRVTLTILRPDDPESLESGRMNSANSLEPNLAVRLVRTQPGQALGLGLGYDMADCVITSIRVRRPLRRPSRVRCVVIKRARVI